MAGKKKYSPPKDLVNKLQHLNFQVQSALPPLAISAPRVRDTRKLAQAMTMSQTLLDQQASPPSTSRLQEPLVPKIELRNVQTPSSPQVSLASRTGQASSTPQDILAPPVILAVQPAPTNQGVQLPQVRVPRPLNPLFTDVNETPHILDESGPFVEIPVFSTLQSAQHLPSSNSQSQAEAMQAFSETGSRIFRNTMNQRAPKPRINPFAGRLDGPGAPVLPIHDSKSEMNSVDPLPSFTEDVNASFNELMRGLRGYQGHVTVQLQFGRIILGNVHSKHISTKERDKLLSARDLQNLLLNSAEHSPTAHFTDILTTVPAEIQYMIGLKARDGKNLWESKVFSWEVTYEFIFFDNSTAEITRVPFMIEINGETFATQVKTRRSLGDMYVHGTKRHWDFKIAAVGHGNSRILEEKYGDLATILVASLYIP